MTKLIQLLTNCIAIRAVTSVFVFISFFFYSFTAFSQVTTVYPQQIANYYTTWNAGTAGAFNQGGFQVGMFANGVPNPKQVVSWRKFRTDASGTNTSDRAMQVGDEFVVTLSATRAFGKIGFALLASPATGSWANRESNYAISVNLDGPAYTGAGWGLWYVRSNGGAVSVASFGGQQGIYGNFTFTLRLTAPNRMNVTVTDGTNTSTFNDVLLNTASPITDYSIFLDDDFDGGINRNIFWGLGAAGTQHSLTNTLNLPIGQSNSSFTIGTVISNGLASNNASTVSINSLTKSGTGTIVLSNSNTYTGTTTVTAGTLALNAVSALPSANALTINGGTLTISNAGALSSTNNITLTSGTLAVGTVAAASTSNIGLLNFSGGTNLNLSAAPASCSLVVANTAGFASGNLTITGWIPTKRIIITNTAHISTVLGRINFSGFGVGAKLINGNELVPQLLFVTNGLGGGNFNVNTAWLNNDPPTAGTGTESIFIQPGDVLVQNTNFNVLNAQIGGTLTMNAVNSLTISGTATHAGTINMVNGSVINMNNGSTWARIAGGSFAGSPQGRIHFLGTGTVTGTVTFPDVWIEGGVNFGTGSTIGGSSSLQINAGFVVTNPPTYAAGSTLVYNSNSPFNRNDEWRAGSSGQGVPHHVRIMGGTSLNLDVTPGYSNGDARTILGNLEILGILTMGGTVASGGSMDEDLTVVGDLTIQTGGSFTLGCQQPSTSVTGDLLLGGNWTRAAGSTFIGSQRAVIFNGTSALQTVSFTGEEEFPYFIITKPGNGTVRLNCDVFISGSNRGHTLQMYDGNLDLNGRTVRFLSFVFDGSEPSVHNIYIDGSAGNFTRQIFNSSVTPANFNFIHGDFVSRTSTIERFDSDPALLSFGTNVVVQISRSGGGASGVNFGSSLTTINGTLQINNGGFVDINAPTYADNSLLRYNIGLDYNRRLEWNTAASGPGHPFHVQLSTNGTRLITGAGGYTGTVLNLRGSLTIDASTEFDMTNVNTTNMTVPLTVGLDIDISGTLLASQVAGGNIILGRNWTRNSGGIFTPYLRSVTFNASRDATITAVGGETFYNLVINKPAFGTMGVNYLAYRVTLNSPVSITNDVTLTSGVFVTAALNLITVNAGATATGGGVESFVSGPMIKIGTTDFRFPVGKIVNSVAPFAYHYRPISISGLGGTSFSYTAEYFRQDPYTQGLISPAALAAGLQNISRCEFWNLTRTGGPATITVTPSWSTHSVWPSQCNVGAYVNDVPSLVVVPFNGPNPLPGSSQWGNADFGQAGSPPGFTNPAYISTITWNAALNYNKFVLGSIDARFNPLPFALLQFEGRKRSSDVLLQWKVAGNQDQQEYLLEHSADGIHFRTIAVVPALADLNHAAYSDLHAQPVTGLNHYRVTARSRLNQFKSSQTIQVWFGGTVGKPGIYPNPIVNNQVNIHTNGLPKGVYNIQLVGMDGKLLLQQRWVNNGNQPVYQLQLNPALPRGMYWIHISGDLQEPIQLKILK